MAITCCRERSVLVAVYAERPKKRPLLDSSNTTPHHHHYHNIHHTTENDGKRYINRRAELLDYARHLRASARLQTSSSAVSSSSNSHIKHTHPILEVVAADFKSKRTNSPTCLGKCEFLMPRFLRSMKVTNKRRKKGKRCSVSTVTKMKDMMKTLQGQKNGNFMSKLFKKSWKHR